MKLQVREEDAEQAISILMEYGYFKDEEKEPSALMSYLNQHTGNIPILKGFPVQVRLLAIIGAVLCIAMVVGVLVTNS